MEKKKSFGLAWMMLLGLVLGTVFGTFISESFATDYIKPFGDLFIRLIRMVVVPLVFATIISGVAGIADISKLGRVAVKTLLVYALTTGVAVIFGLIIAQVVHPGTGLDFSTEGLSVNEVKAPALKDTLLNIVPMNPFDALSKGSMLQIIFFAVFFGFILASMGEKGKSLQGFFEGVGEVMIKMTNAVMHYAPIGVFALIAFTVSKHGLAVLLPLLKLVLCSFIATALFFVVVYIPVVRVYVGIPLKRFFKDIAEPWIIGFTTCSSAAALASNLVATRKLGATKAIASFSIPLGNTINMNGTSIYMGVCAVFAAEIYGIDLTMFDQVTIVLMGIVAAIGTAGVPSAGLIMMSVVFTQVGIPLEAVALIASIDRLLDMIRTSANVIGDAFTAICVTKMEGELDSEEFSEETL
ncbi:dicarboxylate/amino acid:cation symporter [Succinivibrio dextrinosolvens]|jgi:DAACS family dicarboxylate/amino acid:cation (Na+ or H+) symporter|uniref:dicarboxylate/amino acid:cation symporter n=1 Tax=Succinivibrio dextrinosolvens TaxID=83771 RepID=UPI00241EB744|nr:dicarboxylate/amino acid:cation symporter [Succinivibrio dextrinosolvens]MBE6422418.1 dicarboxylate/amino acid:cation symporter [Succinivibrio dextrinosolvens]MBQ3679626.1 dicarboxylate/amino acid:cation symporter [Succinivibrio sp.]